MTTATLRLQRPATASTPAWVTAAIAALGLAMGLASWFGDQWPLTVVVLLFVVIAFVMVLRRPHVGISVFLTTFLINYPTVARGSGYFTINNALGAMFLGLLAWDFYQQRDVWYLREPLVRMLLAIGAVMVVGTIAAEYTLPDSYVQNLIVRRIGAIRSGVDFTERQLFQYFSRVAFVVFLLLFVRTPKQLGAVFLTLLGCIIAAVPPALIQYAQGGGGEEFRIFSKLVNWADNVNRFAFGCVLGMALFFYAFSTVRSAAVRIVSALGVVMFLPLVLLSASRSGFLGLCLLGLLILFGAFGTRGAGVSRMTVIASILILTAVALITFFFVLDPRAQERVLNLNPFAQERLEGATSAEQRAESVEESLALIRRYPLFGTGIGNFRWVNRYVHESRWKPPHNSYLWAAAEGGVILLVFYLALFWMLWRRLGRLRAPYATHEDLPLFPNLLQVYLMLVLFFSFFADVWLDVHLFLLVAGTILMDRWLAARSVEATPPAPVPPYAGQRAPKLPGPRPQAALPARA
jgi:O-antigen ligase